MVFKNMDSGRVDVAFGLGVAFDLDVVFDIAFDFLQFPCVAAVCAVQKMDQEEPLSEV
ncbi:hypothetical protein ACO0LG_25365 [Undibacterium sp. Ji42W]|uniref:hypothetical protein n=1 Tax=Undibacterium sp. Ji42W TaxID=3413039 RepID=UPI003BEF8B62